MFKKLTPRLKVILGIALFVSFTTSCKKDVVVNSPILNDTLNKIKPKGPKPAWGPTITDQMLTVIEKLDSFKTPPLTTLTPQQARKAPTPTDAVKAVMKDYNIPAPASPIDTTGRDIAVKGGKIHLRVYSPKGVGPFPVIVYYHGGGWVIANLDTYDASARALAEKSNAVLVSVAYRQAPEFKFPIAHNDSYAAYKWVIENTALINGNPKKIAIAGESAGGNLATAVSMMSRDSGLALPIHQLVIYPIADNNVSSPSYLTYADAKPLNKPLMQWFFDNYLNTPADGDSQLISLVDANLKKLPPATIIIAQIDPLQNDGEKLAAKFKTDGVEVNTKMYEGVTHEFFGMSTLIPEAKKAQDFAAEELKKAFAK